MSSVHRLPGKPNWVCFFTDRDGNRRCKSTLTTNKREAERVCNEIQMIEDRARSGRLTEDRARRVIESTVAEIMESLGSPVERKTIREHFESWIGSKTMREGTQQRYEGIVQSWLTFLGAKANSPLPALKVDDVERYRTFLAERVSSGTVNVHLKVLRVCLEKAVQQQIFDKNPARLVDNLGETDKHRRRAFTLAELKKLLAVANDEWRSLTLFGLYTGQRLSDLASLTWANLDLQEKELVLRTGKTDRTMIIPLDGPLLKHVESLPAGDDPKAPIFPGLTGKPVSWLSNQFYDTAAAAGLVPERGHQKRDGGKGRGVRRQQSELSFHCLRHTATSLLKNAGVSDVIARDIIGHESEAVSRAYTHIDSETKRAALRKMPDVTK